MVRIFCKDRHGLAPEGCPSCGALIAYARRRLERCPFGEEKPTCADCPIHCYQPGVRDLVKDVMRYAGPRMIFRHPILALRHQIDARREAPPRPRPARPGRPGGLDQDGRRDDAGAAGAQETPS
jgi:hypothetical protein